MQVELKRPKPKYPLWIGAVLMIVVIGFSGYYLFNLILDKTLADFNHSLTAKNYSTAATLYNKTKYDQLKQQMDLSLAQAVKTYRSDFLRSDLDIKPFQDMTALETQFNPIIDSELSTIIKQFNNGELTDKEVLNYASNIEEIGFKIDNSSFQDLVSRLSETYYHDLLKNGTDLEKTQKYQAAATLYQEGLKYFPNDNVLKDKLSLSKFYSKQKAELVPYNGPIEHIFFHPLIAYPELTFSGPLAKGYNDYFVTVSEFNKILDSLYQKNFVLIDINSMYEIDNTNGTEVLKEKQLMLPQGKKPLILSIDDLNYYTYMRQNGNVFRLILDDKGNIATYSVTPEGKERIAYDNEIIPILDQFVKDHPDFSLFGVKGTIALTGYEGILGYRTDELNSPNYASEKEKVLKVVARLKETGWNFASHSYGHPDMQKISYARVVRDTDQWLKEVEPLIGETKIFIYPYGSSLNPRDKKFKYLYSKGFRVFNGVGPRYIKRTDQYILQDRRHVDGYAFHFQRDSNLDLYDANEIIDPIRPNNY